MMKSLLFCLACVPLAGGLSAATVKDPRCERLTDPLGIDATKPGLNWVIESGERGEVQTAYQILVASRAELLAADKGDLWDSGRVASDASAQVEYSGKPLASRMRCHWKARVWDRDGKPSAWSQPASWTMGLLSEEDWKGCWIGARLGTPSSKRVPLRDGDRGQTGPIDPADAPAVLLRREVNLPKRVVRATATFCGLGYGELYINGKRVGDRMLDPAFTDYMRRVLYSTYDVTDLVRSGKNALGVMLGNGFYNTQTPDLFQLEKAPWRTAPRMRLNLLVEFDDGSTSTILSDGQWKQSTGAVRFNCVRGGETIDARKNPGRWLEAGYEGGVWKPALEVTAPLGRLCAQSVPPIRITDQFKPQRITEPKPGVYVVDFGRNLAGWVRWTASGKEGQTVTLDYNEKLRADGTVDTEFQNTHTYGRFQHQECVLSGTKNELFEPRFTYHAFRYVEFRGLDKAPKPEEMVALRLHTQIPRVSSFESSDSRLNLLHNASRRTLEDCTWGGPTAEPHREKVIWLGDNVFEMDAYFYLFDCSLLYRKQVYDLMDAQEPNGHFGPVVPNGGWGEQGGGSVSGLHFCDSPWWSISLALGTHRLRTDYGDRRTSAVSYDACRRYTDYLTSTARDGTLNWGLWDWYPRPGSIETKGEYTSNVAYYYQARLVAEQVAVLGKKEDAAKYTALAESVKTAFNRKFFDAAAGRYAPGSQTAQSLPLFHQMVPAADRKRVLNTLVESMKASGNKLTAGFVGTMPTFYVLTDAGYGDLVYEMIKDGWFNMLGNGDASTLPESPYTSLGGYGSGHHQFSACVAGWMYRCLAGIRPDLSGPGYKKFTIRPAIIDHLTWVKAHYDSVYGRIESNWKREGDKLTLNVRVPCNTKAAVYVPAKAVASVTEGGNPAREAKGVTFLRMDEDAAIFEVGSGSYEFQSTANSPDGTLALADGPPFPIDRTPAPLFDDPVWHGAADPTVLWNPIAKEFTIYYTQRRATLQNPNGVDWVHASAIGIATSKDGILWNYGGICTGDEGLGTPLERKCSWWAPSVMYHDKQFHMFVSCVDGIYTSWSGKRTIKHFISQDGKQWKYRQTLPLSSDNCIDPCVHQIGDRWFVWYKDEGHGSKTYAAESPDLQSWKVRGPAVSDVPHEAPLVWRWKGAYWVIVDAWKGLRIYRSDDGLAGWQYNNTILIAPGKRTKDSGQGGHPGILLQGDRVFVFYQVVYARDRETVLQVAELELDAAGKIVCDRDRYATK